MSMEENTMRDTTWLILTIATLACGELVAEPIVNKSVLLDGDPATEETTTGDGNAFDVMTTEVLDAPSTDAYACQIVPDVTGEGAPVRDGDTLIFERWANGYSNACVQATGPEATACWVPGGIECDDESRPCPTIVPRREAGTGESVMSGGTYMVCAHPCTTDDDCPAPSSGTAVATCVHDAALYGSRNLFAGVDLDRGFQYTGGGSCMIGCASGETCPDGFICSEPDRVAISSDAEVLLSPAPAQCLQFKAVTLRE